MLETPRMTRYSTMSNNPQSAVNQQGRPSMLGTLNDYTLGSLRDEDIVWPAWRHAESSRNDCSLANARVTNFVHARDTGVS